MKEYPLEVKDLVEYQSHGNVVGWYSKGHHAPDVFLQAVVGRHLPEWLFTDVEPVDVQHRWVRNVPDGDGGYFWANGKQGSRGVYPITEVSFYAVDDRGIQELGSEV